MAQHRMTIKTTTTRVTAYTTSDGKLHHTKAAAEQHQAMLELTDFADDELRHASADDAACAMAANADRLIRLLKAASKNLVAVVLEEPAEPAGNEADRLIRLLEEGKV